MSLFKKTEEIRRPYRRRNYFINKGMQGRFTVYFLMLGFFISLGTSAVIWYFASVEFEQYAFRSHVPRVLPWEVVFTVLAKNLFVLVCVLVGSTYLLARLIFRKMSSRLASLKEAMERIGAGDLAMGVPEGGIENLNEMLDDLRERLREKVTALDRIRREMGSVLEDQSAPETKKNELARLSAAFGNELTALGYNSEKE